MRNRKTTIGQIVTSIIRSALMQEEVEVINYTLVNDYSGGLRVIYKGSKPIIIGNNVAVWGNYAYNQEEIENKLNTLLYRIELGKERNITEDQKNLIKEAKHYKLNFPTTLYVTTSLDNAFKFTLAYWKDEIIKIKAKRRAKDQRRKQRKREKIS